MTVQPSTVRDMRIRDLLSPGAVVRGDEPILAAVDEMNYRKTWVVCVVGEDDAFLGTFTPWDVVLALGQRVDSGETRLADRPLNDTSVAPDEPVDRAVEVAGGVGHFTLPVVEDGRLLGIITGQAITAQQMLRAELGDAADDVLLEVDPEDDMFYGDLGGYLIGATTALKCVRRAMVAAGVTDPRSILDMPCGHGRVLRVLKMAFPDARFTACDIKREGVDFCAHHFGARPLYAAPDPADVVLGERFDLIWVGSLFTHFEKERWRNLLDLLAAALEPGGLLVFSALSRVNAADLHNFNLTDEQVEQMLADYDRDGFGFQPYPDMDRFGMTINSPEFAREEIARRPGLELVSFEKWGWSPPTPAHDIYACVKTGT